MTLEDQYLHATIRRHQASPGDPRPQRLRSTVRRLLQNWELAAWVESVTVAGSHAKGTALRGSDVDIFVSLAPGTPGSLANVQSSIARHLTPYYPEKRNVAVRIQVEHASVDVVVGRRRENSPNHTLWQARHQTWLQTDLTEQTRHARAASIEAEAVALKLWRRQRGLRFPSFLMELAAIRALTSCRAGSVSERFLSLLEFLATDFEQARLIDPANSNNIVSDALSPDEALKIASAAATSLKAASWPDII